MTSENAHTLNTIKGHGLAVGDRVHFHGMGSDPLPTVEGTRVEIGKVGAKYMLTTVTGEVMTWEFGASAKVWISTDVAHDVTTEARTLDNGDTVYVGQCEHGWMTGFHTTEADARAVATGHGEVSRPLYVAPVILDASDVAEYNAQQWAEAGSPRDAKGAPIVPVEITGAEVEAARVAVRDNGRVFVAEAHNFGGLAAFAILVESGTHTLINDGDMSRWVRTRRTADRVTITDGLAVWDYDMNVGRVVLSSMDGDGWFDVKRIDGGRALMNGERVTTVHPFTGRPAEAEVSMPPATVDASDFMSTPTVPVADGEDYCDDIPTSAEEAAMIAEHDTAMREWARPLVAALTVPAPVVTEAEVWAGTGTVVKYPLTRPVRTNLNKRKRKATKVNARRVRGGF